MLSATISLVDYQFSLFRTASLNNLLIIIITMSHESELSNTMYDLLHAMGKDAGFLYETIDTYIKDAQNANKSDLVETWQTIKKDRLKHLHMLKQALEKEIHG